MKMTCKDCIHYEICEIYEKENGIKKIDARCCRYFKDISKGCKCCSYTEPPRNWTYENDIAFIIGNEAYIQASDPYDTAIIRIKYCPMCGRPLEREMK